MIYFLLLFFPCPSQNESQQENIVNKLGHGGQMI